MWPVKIEIYNKGKMHTVRSIWSNVFQSNVSLLISYLDDLSIVENGVLKPPLLLICCLFLPSDLLVFA